MNGLDAEKKWLYSQAKFPVVNSDGLTVTERIEGLGSKRINLKAAQELLRPRLEDIEDTKKYIVIEGSLKDSLQNSLLKTKFDDFRNAANLELAGTGFLMPEIYLGMPVIIERGTGTETYPIINYVIGYVEHQEKDDKGLLLAPLDDRGDVMIIPLKSPFGSRDPFKPFKYIYPLEKR